MIIVTAFMLGIVVGASGQYLLFHQPPPPRALTITDAADELTRVLRLDESQRSQVIQILSECQRQNQDLKKQAHPQYQAIRDSARNRIRSVLSVEQQTLYNQWTKDLDAKREKRALEEGKQPNK